MKNSNPTLRLEEFHAKQAAKQIITWVGKKYPGLCASTKKRMIAECLIELKEERKFLTAHR